MSGLEIRVVLWPQPTRTSGGPPDSVMWWSGGLLETLTINPFLVRAPQSTPLRPPGQSAPINPTRPPGQSAWNSPETGLFVNPTTQILFTQSQWFILSTAKIIRWSHNTRFQNVDYVEFLSIKVSFKCAFLCAHGHFRFQEFPGLVLLLVLAKSLCRTVQILSLMASLRIHLWLSVFDCHQQLNSRGHWCYRTIFLRMMAGGGSLSISYWMWTLIIL